MFKPEAIGYFNPNLDKREFRPSDITEKGSRLYYRSVYMFLDAALDYAVVIDDATVRLRLSRCL